MEGRRPRMMSGRALMGAVAVLALAGTAFPSRADGPPADGSPPGSVTLTGLRTWTSPSGTRVVLDFSAAVTPVAPDSGQAVELVVALPGESISIATEVPSRLV